MYWGGEDGKPDLIGATIITTPTNHTHSFIQVIGFINRKAKTIVSLSNEPKSLGSVYLLNLNPSVITPNNLVQAIFYFITKANDFYNNQYVHSSK